MATLAKRRPEAVRELEFIQQQERAGAGEPALTVEDFLRLVREDAQKGLIAARLRTGGMPAVIAASAADERLAEQQSAALLRGWSLDDPTQWSRYEPPGVRWGIAEICGRIEAVFARHGWSLAEVPVVGTLTTGQVSATTQKSQAGAPLVLIENGFFKFARVLGQLAVFAPYDAAVRGGFSFATLQLLGDLVATQIVLNTCLYLYERSTPPEYQSAVANFQDAISVFVIAHEYAHVSAGDLDAHPSASGGTDDNRHSKEFEADKIGFITSVEAAPDPGAGVFGAFLYFAGLDLLGQARAAYKDQLPPAKTTPASDYPTPYERTISLLNWLQNSPYMAQFEEQLRKASRYYNVILFVWDQVQPAFRAARGQLAAFDPALHGASAYPEADAFGVVETLSRYLQAGRSLS